MPEEAPERRGVLIIGLCGLTVLGICLALIAFVQGDIVMLIAWSFITMIVAVATESELFRYLRKNK